MLMKYLMPCAGRRSYSVGRVLVQYMKSQHEHLHRYFYLHSKHISRKSTSQDLAAKNAITESFKYAIQKNDEKSVPKTRPRRKVVDEITNFVNKSCPIEVRNAIPKKCFKRNRKMTEQMYLVVPDVADTIVRCVKKNLVKKGVVVLETNPGLGVLSKKLIDAGVEKLHLHEPSPSFYKILKDFHRLHFDKVTLHSTDFLSLWKIAYQDKMDRGTRVQDILFHYPKKSWNEEPALKVIGCIQSSDFIKHLILSLVFQSGIMTHCRPELYFLMPPSLHLRLTCTGEDGYLRYRSISVLFQLFFDFEILEKIPRKAYLPWAMPHSTKKRKVNEIAALNEEWFYLMKIVPKKDLYETISVEKLPGLWYFVRHHYWSRSSRVIQEMESWIPGCGVRLILEGYDIFTEFGDLKPSQALHIFQLFSSWPEYRDSSFLSSLETALLKLDENASDKLDNDEKDDNVANEDNEHLHKL